ncbi:DNA polymerase subunit gamma-2, mitochondrial isoform X1 [Callorhinchus milii]|nr:DNA polymerase subunit gamma-2, mitochondrial isoform X1 [Callorhinchus milii]
MFIFTFVNPSARIIYYLQTAMPLIVRKHSVWSVLKQLKTSNMVLKHDWQIFVNWYQSKKYTKSTFNPSGFTDVLISLCQSRRFIIEDIITQEALLNGSYSYGPLGMELKKNLITKWWDSMVLSKERVFGIETPQHMIGSLNSEDKTMTLVETEVLRAILRNKNLSMKETIASLEELLKKSAILRSNLLEGAFQLYAKSLNLVNEKLPFGLAEVGVCYQPVATEHETTSSAVRTGEVEVASLVWFSSPRTSGQWRDYWVRQRLLWWRKFARHPSSFTANDFQDENGIKGTALYFSFPWGKEPIETLLSLEEKEVVLKHLGSKSELQGRDGRKTVVPHVLSVSGNLDRGVMAYLTDSLHLSEQIDSKCSCNQKQVLKLHPFLVPIKVALDVGRGSTGELRQVCEGLFRQMLEKRINTWPGYLETAQVSMEQLFTKYDEMGVIFTIVINESTLESGLVQLRNRDTTMKETMHISEVIEFLTKYIQES